MTPCPGVAFANVVFRVRSVRRYPVKSMSGESLDRVILDSRGLSGDRWFAVEDGEGRFASGKDTRRFRRRDAVFDYLARTDSDGQVWVSRDDNEWLVGDSRLDEDVSQRMGCAARVTPEAGVPHQDMGAVSIIGTATLDWCSQAWGGDGDERRLRVNVVLETTEPFVEESWLGRTLHVGTAALGVVERVPRCRMIDIAQDGTVPTEHWLKEVARDRDMLLAVYADVLSPGQFRVGDQVGVE